MEKVDLCKGYWKMNKVGVATHFFKIISFESQQKSTFFENRRKGYFFTDFFKIRIYVEKSKHFYKNLETTW